MCVLEGYFKYKNYYYYFGNKHAGFIIYSEYFVFQCRDNILLNICIIIILAKSIFFDRICECFIGTIYMHGMCGMLAL